MALTISASCPAATAPEKNSPATVRLWNIASRAELLVDRRLGEKLHTLVFSPDGQLLVGAGLLGSAGDGLRIYHAPRIAAAVFGSREPGRRSPREF